MNNNIKKNTYFLTITRFSNAFLSFLLIPFATRYLKPEGYGVYVLASTLMFFVFLFNDLGMNTYVTREIAKRTEDALKYYSNALILKISFVLANFLMILGFIKILGFGQEAQTAIMVFAFYGLATSVMQLNTAVFQAFERMHFESYTLIFEKILITGAGILILLTGHGVIALCLVFLASGAISTLMSTVFVHRYFFKIKLSFNFGFSRELVRSSLPFGVSLFLGMIYNSIGIIILSKMQPAEVVGWFSAGERLLRFTGILPTILSIALFPALSREMGQSKERFAELFTKGFKYSSFLAIPMIAGITILAPTIVRILFGPEYTNTTGVLQILAWVAGLIFFNIFLAALFKAANYQKLFVKIQVAAVVLNLILNLVLIHYFAHIGASIAMLATEGMIFCIGLAFALYKISKLQESLFILKVLGATSVMSLVTIYLRDYNLVLVVVISTLIYFGVLYLLNGFILREFLVLRRN